MDYSKYEVEDYASDDLFIRWVADNDPDAAAFWEAYMLDHPDVIERIERARLLVLALREDETHRNVAEQVARSWEAIQDRIRPARKTFVVWKIAASLSAIAAVGLIWYFVQRNADPIQREVSGLAWVEDLNYVEEVNTSGEVVTVNLSDGSVVRLENNSRLRYFRDCANDPYRKVYLTGEAFFEIAKNPQQPFFVYANEVVTRVLGTSFRVKAFDNDERVVVSVQEGKVSVYSSRRPRKDGDTIEAEVNGVVLTPNQKVHYQRAEDSFNKTLVDTPQVIKQEVLQRDFEFRSTPVHEVFEVLSEAYGVEIIFDKQVLENCYLTVPLGDEPLFEKLKIVCSTIDATYELIDANIVISSSGCLREESR